MVVEFTEELERNRLAYSERFRFAAAIGKEWKIVESQDIAAFYDALREFGAGQDAMVSAYQAERSARQIIRDIQKRSEWTPDDIRSSSVPLHLTLSQGLWGQGIPNFVTVGTIQIDGVDVWKPTLESLRDRLLTNQDETAPLDAHAWISFPDMSVIDVTWWFHEHRAALPRKYSWPDRIVVGEPVRGTAAYEPLVAGIKFPAGGLALPLHRH